MTEYIITTKGGMIPCRRTTSVCPDCRLCKQVRGVPCERCCGTGKIPYPAEKMGQGQTPPVANGDREVLGE